MNQFDRLNIPNSAPKDTGAVSSLLSCSSAFLRLKRHVLVGGLLPVMLGLAACQSANDRAADLASQADAFAQAGNLVAARNAISQAISLREDEPHYHELLGAISMQSGDPIGAYRAFTRALEFDATNKIALAYVANIGVQIGQINDADDAADKLLTLEPNALPALQVKGMVALSKAKFDDAMTMADRILAIKPTDEAGAIIKARALAKAGKAEEAVKLLAQARAAMPNSPALITNQLNMYRFMRQGEPMIPLAAELVQLSKGGTAPMLDQINLLYKLGKIEDARKASSALLEAGSRNPEDYRTLQRFWSEYDKTPFPDAAARNASRWKDPIAVVLTVRYLFAHGDLASADGLLRTASPQAQPMLASLKARMFDASGRQAEARQQVDAVLAKDDHDVDALLLRAQFLKREGKMDAAIEAAQQAQANDPLNPEGYVVLASIYDAQQSQFRAKQIFEDGMKSLPQNFYLLETYTQYLHGLGDKGRAVSVNRAFGRGMPSSVRAWTIMMAQCQWANDQVCAQTAMQGYGFAKASFKVDDPPGTPPNRGLFGAI